jgi:hypothetical protein
VRVAYNVGRVYARREAERDVLYRVLQEHVATFLQGTESDEHAGLPRHVRREFYGYLDCGILARGAARVACAACKDSILVAFSCRGHGFRPSCGARRMSDTAAHLVDRVLLRGRLRTRARHDLDPRVQAITHPRFLITHHFWLSNGCF